MPEQEPRPKLLDPRLEETGIPSSTTTLATSIVFLHESVILKLQR